MTKAGGVAAHPTVALETGGGRMRSKSDAGQKDAASDFAFPDQLSSLENAEPGDTKPAKSGMRAWPADFGRRFAIAHDAIVRDQSRSADPAAEVATSELESELARILDGGLADSSAIEDGAAGGEEVSADGDRPADTPAIVQAAATSAQLLGPVTRASINQWSMPTSAQVRPAIADPDQETQLFKQVALPTEDADIAPVPRGAISPEGETDVPDMPIADARRLQEGATRDSRDAGDRDVARAEVKVTSVRQETHFVPVGRSTPAQQIAEALSSADAEQAQRPIFDPAAQARSSSPLRVLQVQLQPVHLGTVTVSLSLRADVLEVQLAASQPGTADMLKQDRQMLSELLRQSGYDIDSINVRIAEPDAAVTTNPTQTQMPSQSVATPAGQMQSSGWTLADDRSRDARQQPGQQPDQGAGGNRGNGAADPAGNSAPGVYL